MIRVLLALVATVLGVVLVLGYRTLGPPRDSLADRLAVVPRVSEGRPGQHCHPARKARTRVTGPPAAWSYGHLRVRATVVGCRIVDVTVVELVTTNPVSQRRSSGAVPRLREEVRSEQCAAVDVVSGATYTSQAYLRSLQAVLDATHAGQPCR
jgi:uncharacterized protein with FMN-binding domain